MLKKKKERYRAGMVECKDSNFYHPLLGADTT